MKPVIGYWSWDAATRTMHRTDGSAVRFLGIDHSKPKPGAMLWMNFEVSTGYGRLRLPVQQRLVGRDTNFRALWYKVDFREAVPDALVWAAAERLIADALSSWPRGDLIDGHPTGVGIVGGFLGGSFDQGLYRLYLPQYAGRPLPGGKIAPITKGRRWSVSPFSSAPSGTAQPIVTLAADRSTIALRDDVDGGARLDYREDGFRSDRFVCSPPYAGQDWLWSVYEWGPSNEALTRDDRNIVERLFPALRPKPKRGQLEPLTLDEAEHAYSAFHEALLTLPPGAVRTKRLVSPPIVVKSVSPWPRAGYLPQDCLTATELRGEELEAAFGDEPPAERMLVSPAGSAFDSANGIFHGPDGALLRVERINESLGVTPVRLTLRCRTSDLDWPVIVCRRDRRPHHIDWTYEPQLLSRWVIDHGECLKAWQGEGHIGIPDPSSWDRMRQFLEDAILSWGDGAQGGPAPQSLATSGGWYDGTWHDDQFRRLLSRPIRAELAAKTEPWIPYAQVMQWRRIESVAANRAGADGQASSESTATGNPFVKAAADQESAQVFASGYVERGNFGESVVRKIVDYQDGLDHVRLVGAPDRLLTGGVVRIEGQTSVPGDKRADWPKASAVEQPSLRLWRRLRDAAESGLRSGESMTVNGGYFFDRFYTTSIRITALAADFTDFDYHMFEAGNGFY